MSSLLAAREKLPWAATSRKVLMRSRLSMSVAYCAATRDFRLQRGQPVLRKPGRDAVDRDVDAALQPLVVLLPGAPAAHQLDLQVVQRIDVGEAVADRALHARRCLPAAASRR